MSAARLGTCHRKSVLAQALPDDVKRSLDRRSLMGLVVGRTPTDPCGVVRSHAKRARSAVRLDPISPSGSAVGKPYWGKPDVRFDEGDQRTPSRQR